MNPTHRAIARELFAQWRAARGDRLEPASRPFTRDWEHLLETAGIVSATDRSDTERDARALAAEGWVQLKPVRYRPHLIHRIVLPLDQESCWRAAFGFAPPSDEEARLIREFDWAPELQFVRQGRIQISFDELRQLNGFLISNRETLPTVPIKERSLLIFGDEKRLDALLTSSLFRPERLSLASLCCEIVGEPLAWKRGPLEAAARPIIAIENAATWHSYCRWNVERGLFSAVIYGCGNRFVDGVRYLADLFGELGGPRRVLYFGDLDPQGLLIPQEASVRAQAAGLPAVEPHGWSYRQLLALGADRSQPWEGEPPASTLCDWLGELADPARELFRSGRRLAQEHVGWEFLQHQDEKEK